MEEVVGQKGQQQETFDGIGIMAKNVIGMPLLGELLESVILDIPALVAENNGALGRKLGRGCGSHPDPLAAEELLLVIELPSYLVSFPASESPAPASAPAARKSGRKHPTIHSVDRDSYPLRRLLGKQRRRIHIQVPAFLLQHHQRMFAVRQQEVEKGSRCIKRIGQ